MKPTIQQLTSALQKSWDATTGYAGITNWPADNPARGQCVISALVIQDYLGGDIIRYEVTGDGIETFENHYFNVLDNGTFIDTTIQQYKQPVSMTLKPINLKGKYRSSREKRLDDDETRKKYLLLKSKVAAILSSDT